MISENVCFYSSDLMHIISRHLPVDNVLFFCRVTSFPLPLFFWRNPIVVRTVVISFVKFFPYYPPSGYSCVSMVNIIVFDKFKFHEQRFCISSITAHRPLSSPAAYLSDFAVYLIITAPQKNNPAPNGILFTYVAAVFYIPSFANCRLILLCCWSWLCRRHG